MLTDMEKARIGITTMLDTLEWSQNTLGQVNKIIVRRKMEMLQCHYDGFEDLFYGTEFKQYGKEAAATEFEEVTEKF
jgi:hypothetical protein